LNTESVRVSLDLFEGPLDLLLHLIQVQQIDISEISISEITADYLKTLEMMREMDLDIAGEYLVMAATLILIKSRLLLPPAPFDDSDGLDTEDPRETLVERLKQYQTYREAGRHLQSMNEIQRQHLPCGTASDDDEQHTEWIIDATLVDLLKALKDIIRKHGDESPHLVVPNPISVREKMIHLVGRLTTEPSILLSELFHHAGSKQEVIVIFLAVLELVRIRTIQARQRKIFGDIRLTVLPGATLGNITDG
jgi:segregation and condensation protein A